MRQRPLQEVQVLVAMVLLHSGPFRCIAVEGEDAVGFVCIADIELVLHPLPAKDDLVLAVHPGHVVVEGEGVVVEVRDGVGAAADGELVGSSTAGRSART